MPATICNLNKLAEKKWEFFKDLRSHGLSSEETYKQIAAYYGLSYSDYLEKYEQMEVLRMGREVYEEVKAEATGSCLWGLIRL